MIKRVEHIVKCNISFPLDWSQNWGANSLPTNLNVDGQDMSEVGPLVSQQNEGNTSSHCTISTLTHTLMLNLKLTLTLTKKLALTITLDINLSMSEMAICVTLWNLSDNKLCIH